ncbi:hypothetical protein HHL19_17615 [Streptomyces sp. R302]|uniref:hypothetical protein n=1 Tax=unclassified Streptomyces TaxID=2593676 RepID=UPI00145E7AFC|nr:MULTISPECIES: hypothetical protein [unclassified Streptomyces]NML52620.1 hypothetical protein [Streptomyces sp. R301]NML80451.1 hypothetical protein [Streptomyces sp. R302]
MAQQGVEAGGLAGEVVASTRRITLKDQPGQQTFDLRGCGVTRIRVMPETAYGAGRGRHLAVAEIEFFGHRG